MSAALPYNIETVPGCGRVLVAARDLAPWELVLEDTCLAVIPCDTPVCLACLGEVLVTCHEPLPRVFQILSRSPGSVYSLLS